MSWRDQLLGAASRHKHQQEHDGDEKPLRQLLKAIRELIDALPDGVLLLDSQNNILLCNRTAKNLAGFRPRKDRGRRVEHILRDPALAKLLRTGDAKSFVDIKSPIDDGHWLNCRIVLYGEDHKLLLLRDVTERVSANRMRRDFAANASHELRSPLTVISGYLDGLANDTDVPIGWAEPVSQMQQQALRMNRIVGELLDLARLENESTARSDTSVDIGALLASAKDDAVSQSGHPNIVLSDVSSAWLRGNRHEIESVVSNLVSNAIRHTGSEGTITLSWTIGSGGAEMVVEDTGEGIAPEHIPRLTERFFRVDRGRSRGDGGAGLGLAIVKHVLERHNAELKIESESGAGSRFVCHFPLSQLATTP